MVPIPFRKSRRAANTEDFETWVDEDVANTLNTYENTDVRATQVVVTNTGRGFYTEAPPIAPLTEHHHKDPMHDLVVERTTFSIYPESGQGADLRASECEVAPAVTVNAMERTTDRGTFVADDVAVRRLTPMECERLQGFPDGWTEGHADTTRYKMMGNAVCVPVISWIARNIAALEVDAEEGAA